MPLASVQFGPGSGPERSSYANDGVLINCFAEPSRGGKAAYALYVAPGLDTFSTFSGGGVIRGRFILGNLMYVVCGETLYKVTSGGTASIIGTVLGSLPISAAANRKSPFQQVLIIADNNYYVLENDALTAMSDADLPSGGHSVAFLDGYLIVGFPDGTFYWSAINDANNWDALDFAEAEAKTDNLVRVAVFADRLFLFGEASVEQWVNSGDPDLPFVPQQGSLIERGLLSKFTPIDMDNTIFWLDQKGFVVRAEGTIGRVVSDFAVHKDVQATMKAGEQDQITASTWARDGHEFYELHGPDWCWVYDASTQQWWQRQSEDKDTWRARFHLRAFNKDLVCSYDGAVLFEQLDTVYDEVGYNLVMKMRSSTVEDDTAILEHNALHLLMEMGVGSATDEVPPAAARTFNFTNSVEGWTASQNCTLSQDAGKLIVTHTATGEVGFQIDGLNITGSEFPIVVARVRRIAGTGGWRGALFPWWTPRTAPDGAFASANVATEPTDQTAWSVVSWDLTTLGSGTEAPDGWITNTVLGFRMDLGQNDATAVWEVDWIAITDSGALDHITNPAVMLRWSDDGGSRFSNQLSTSLGNTESDLGAQGDYDKRIKFTRLGTSTEHGRIYEVSVSAPVTKTFIKAKADVQPVSI